MHLIEINNENKVLVEKEHIKVDNLELTFRIQPSFESIYTLTIIVELQKISWTQPSNENLNHKD